ncbi:MAG: HigA family addiction module antidote protein [Flavobacteriaceae bacterium]|nr:HigA family addiction module antidote protein [Flavobacteriaceae bacterium]
MKEKKLKNKINTVYTERMNTDNENFDNFQATILNRSQERSTERKYKIALMANKIRIQDYLNSNFKKQITVGYFLNEYLTTFNLRQNQVATYIGTQPASLNKIINGQRELSHELALKLGRLFRIDPMILLDIQDKNKLRTLQDINKSELTRYSLKDLISK